MIEDAEVRREAEANTAHETQGLEGRSGERGLKPHESGEDSSGHC